MVKIDSPPRSVTPERRDSSQLRSGAAQHRGAHSVLKRNAMFLLELESEASQGKLFYEYSVVCMALYNYFLFYNNPTRQTIIYHWLTLTFLYFTYLCQEGLFIFLRRSKHSVYFRWQKGCNISWSRLAAMASYATLHCTGDTRVGTARWKPFKGRHKYTY